MVEDRADLPNAIALNSSMVNASRILGPSIGGVLIAAVGEGWCFLIDAISYIAVIASLLAMRLPRARTRRARDATCSRSCATGFRYVTGFAPIRTALLLLALVSTMGMPYTVLMPAIAAKVLHGGPHTLGLLMTASGVGALGGALYLASRRSRARPRPGDRCRDARVRRRADRVLARRARSGCRCSSCRSSARGFMVADGRHEHDPADASSRSELRGRVMAFYTMAFLGTAPIGSLLAGVAGRPHRRAADDPARRRRLRAGGRAGSRAGCPGCASRSGRSTSSAASSPPPRRQRARTRRSAERRQFGRDIMVAMRQVRYNVAASLDGFLAASGTFGGGVTEKDQARHRTLLPGDRVGQAAMLSAYEAGFGRFPSTLVASFSRSSPPA